MHLDGHSALAGYGMEKRDGIDRGTWQLENADFQCLVHVEIFKIFKNSADK